MTPSSSSSTPFISDKSVDEALASLLYTSYTPPPNPIGKLLLVEQMMSDPALPNSAHKSEFAVQHLLVSQITDALIEHRFVWGLQPPSEQKTLQEALTALSADMATGSVELIAWSWLYHRYVRVDLDLSLERLNGIVGFNARTLRRYQRHGVRRLRNRLIAAEWQARMQQKQHRLYAALPVSTPIKLFGRDALIREACALFDNGQPHHLFITGAAGIGKTAFAQTLLRSLIDAGCVDQLLWLDRPASCEVVMYSLTGQFVGETSSIPLREYLLMHRVFVVLDDIEFLTEQHAALENLLNALSAASIILTSRIFTELRSIFCHQALPELSETDTYQMVYSIAHQQYREQDVWKDLASATWKAVGGNPLAIKLVAQRLEHYEPISAPVSAMPHELEQFYANAYQSLNDKEQYLWLWFALLPAGEVNTEMISAINESQLVHAPLRRLAELALIEKVSFEKSTYAIHQTARRYLQEHYAHDSQAQAIVMQILDALHTQIINANSRALDFARHLLLGTWADIPHARRRMWINVLAQRGIQRGEWGIWRCILENTIRLFPNADYELCLLYGVCLRKLYEWEGAEETLKQIAVNAGREGLFVVQAKALLELGIVARYQGNYSQALALFAQVERTAQRYQDTVLTQQLYLEYAQFNIDIGDGAAAHRYLDGMIESERVLALRSESSLILDEFEQAKAFAERALVLCQGDRFAEARLYTTLGRCHERQSMYSEARHFFSLALTIFERIEDSFALARARSNLGAVLIHTEEWGEARHLLREAERIQQMLSDQTGLAHTHHNLELLGARFRG